MSPRTKEQNEAIREMRMKQILRAAADVYLEKGIHMEIRDVAVKAELGYGTVYHYYKNKLMLLEDMMWNGLDEAEAAVRPAVEGSGNGAARGLKSFCRLLLNKCVDDPAVFIFLKMIAENFHQMPGNRFLKLTAAFQERLYLPLLRLAAEESDAAPPDKLANMMIGSLVGCAALHVHHGEQSGFDAEQVVGILLSGIQAKEKSER